MRQTIPALLQPIIARAPDAVAARFDDAETSNAAFDALARRIARGLAAQGIGPGDRIAVWLPNRIEWLALFLALARLGAVLVAVNTRYRSSEVEYILQRSGARMLVMQRDFRHIDFPAILAGVSPKAAPALESAVVIGGASPSPVLGRPALGWDALLAAQADYAEADDPEAPCILFTTSGTTRGPKLVVHRQRSIAAHAQAIERYFGFDAPGAKLLGVLPFCGVFGLVGAVAALASGAPILGLETFDGERAAALLQQEKATHVFGTDEMLSRMLAAADSDSTPFPSLRVFGYAAFQPGGVETARQACERGLPMIGLYGSSEAQALFAAQPAELPVGERILPGGRPIAAEAAARVCDPETGVPLPPGESGELQLRGPSLFAEYLDDPEATAAAVTADSFFRTGDLARMRVDGGFVFEARVGDVLRLGGFLVSPADIEEVVEGAPGVEKAQIVGVPMNGGLAPVAFVTMKPGAAVDVTQVVARCRERMARFKVPARVWIIDAFPVIVSSNGTKIQRAKLRDMALERIAAEGAGE
jgi:fatty-acyl-CoA synthase